MDNMDKLSVHLPSEEPYADNGYPFGVIICSAISCFLSIAGSFVIFGSFAAIPEIRNFTRKLIFWLTIADFLTAAGYVLGMIQITLDNSHDVCVVQSFITTYSSLVSFFLTMATMFHLGTTVISKSNVEDKRRFVGFVLFSFLIPGVIVGIAYGEGALGATDSKGTGPWCWIDSTHSDHVMWQVITGKGWEILCYLVTVSYYILLKLYMHLKHRNKTFSTIHKSLRDDDRNLLYVWFIFYSIRIWGTIRFLVSAIEPNSTHKTYMNVLLYLQSFGDPLQAFCNCVLFCFLDKTVRTKLLQALRNDKINDNKTVNSNERRSGLDHRQDNKPTTPLLTNGNHTRYDGVYGVHNRDELFVSPYPGEFSTPHEGSFDDYHTFNYNSPMSTPCHTPRVSPESFTSLRSVVED